MRGQPAWMGRHGARLALALAALLLLPGLAGAAPPLPEAQRASFTASDGSPLVATGVSPADILIAGPVPAIWCGDLGLRCTPSLLDEPNDEIGGLSYGWDFYRPGSPVQFSVAAGAQGLPGTAVHAEANCRPAEPEADVYEGHLDGINRQLLDGDGLPCAGNSGPGLGLAEVPASDDLGALAGDPCLTVDLDCDGAPEGPVYFTLAAGSPSLGLLGAGSADILAASKSFGPVTWAAGSALGLVPGDAIDALCLREDGDGRYGPGDRVVFSLAPGSPTLARLGASPADLLVPGVPSVVVSARALGLAPTDDVDGLACAFDLFWRYLPLVLKSG